MQVYGQFDPDMADFRGGADTGPITALVDALRPLDGPRTRLLRHAAHELRTPLTTIAGFVELLADRTLGPVTDEQERVLRTVARNARHLMSLVGAFDPACPQQPGDEPDGGEGV